MTAKKIYLIHVIYYINQTANSSLFFFISINIVYFFAVLISFYRKKFFGYQFSFLIFFQFSFLIKGILKFSTIVNFRKKNFWFINAVVCNKMQDAGFDIFCGKFDIICMSVEKNLKINYFIFKLFYNLNLQFKFVLFYSYSWRSIGLT